jgi:hypothetical protein
MIAHNIFYIFFPNRRGRDHCGLFSPFAASRLRPTSNSPREWAALPPAGMDLLPDVPRALFVAC